MADPTPKRGPSDATDYSSSKAPETNQEAEERDHPIDPRLHPGGAHGTKVDPGMSSLGAPAAAASERSETSRSSRGWGPAGSEK